jgi:hypothetical protein
MRACRKLYAFALTGIFSRPRAVSLARSMASLILEDQTCDRQGLIPSTVNNGAYGSLPFVASVNNATPSVPRTVQRTRRLVGEPL